MSPLSAKAAMLYTLRRSAWNTAVEPDVPSYASPLVAAENAAAAAAHPAQQPQLHGESS